MTNLHLSWQPCAVASLLLCLVDHLHAGDAATRTLERGELRIVVALPGFPDEHYRGVRFDHGGIVTEAVWRGHGFLGPLKQPRDPMRHDGASGTPEEFHISDPPGFEAAVDGGPFLKIGIGTLIRPDRRPYRFSRTYAVQQPASWKVEADEAAVACTHEASAGSYAVRATRTIAMLPDDVGFRITNELTCLGTAALPIEHYNHTMVVIDGQAIGPEYALAYNTPVAGDSPLLAAETGEVRFTSPLPAGKNLLSGIRASDATSPITRVGIMHRGIGVMLDLSVDTPPSKVALYAESTALCPEFFTSFTLQPGEARRWSQTYRFAPAPHR